MFSKALFKQSCKANGTMWCVITFAVCFMLACVMLISGNGNIGEVKNSIQDTIIMEEIDSELEKRSLSYYSTSSDGLEKFDELFVRNASSVLSYLKWYSSKPLEKDFSSKDEYLYALNVWQEAEIELTTDLAKDYKNLVKEWEEKMPQITDYSSENEYMLALNKWMEETPANSEKAITNAYLTSLNELQEYIIDKATSKGYSKDSTEAQEMLGSVMYVLNPNGTFNDFYEENNETIPSDYDITTLITHITLNDINSYLLSDERSDYRNKRASSGSAVFVAGNMVKEENVKAMRQVLASYGVTNEKYNSFGYTYEKIKHMANVSIVTYQSRLEYEVETIKTEYENGKYESLEKYLEDVEVKKEELKNTIASSFLSTLPETVSDALEEIGQADLYTLIVGSIFYKLAGLLLPIIYMIMASNNLISGQVDSGSMAYVLSTSTKRSTIVFTQMVYLLGSLLAMFTLTSATSCVCLSIISEEVELTYSKLLLLNLGAFMVLFALSGLCFFTSCVFDRSKRSMAIGGGLSIFALVAAMLGLFGSPVIPTVVRLESLNYFNYVTVISLFDVISIIEGSLAFVYKFVILGVLGIVGYLVGSVIFTKKDLPL